MFRRFSVNYALLSIVLDGITVCIALGIASLVRPYLSIIPYAAEFPEVVETPWVIYLIFAIEWIAINLLFSVYDGRKNLRPVDEFSSLTLASILASVALAGTLYLSFRQVSRLLFVFFIVLAYLLMLSWRGFARVIFRMTKFRPERQRQVLIAGAGPVGRELQRQIQLNPQLRLKVLGFVDDNPEKHTAHEEILGKLANTVMIVEDNDIDDVVIALPQSAHKQINHLIINLHHLPVKVWVIPDYFRLALHKAGIEEFAGIPMLDLRAPALNEYQRMVKRAFDVILTIIIIPFALLLMGLIALAIRLESPGFIIFHQKRVGENGRIFKMHKFRTMNPEAEALRPRFEKMDEKGRLIHKQHDDPRVTNIGRFLRRTSLDELPQLFNVLKGDMSLVGPRPELPYLVAEYETWQRQRFSVPQGITGWWQINGRSDKPMHLNTEDDLYYVHHYSLLFDIYILFKTIIVVFQGRGAF